MAFWGLIALVAGARIVAISTENINWDEFALLQRAELSARTGQVIGGGRPGLATLLLLPIADACRDAISVMTTARVLWTGIVVGSAVAFWLLLWSAIEPARQRWAAVATGVGLWVLSPPFLRFSTQVRTDQPAVLFGLLGGMALIASRRRAAWAIVAGALFGIGFLFTQKLLYVGGLVAMLAAGQLLVRREWQTRREAVRVVLTAVTFLAVIITYRIAMAGAGVQSTMLPVSGALNTFEHYRDAVGWSSYIRMTRQLIPQLLVLLLLAFVAFEWLRRRRAGGRYLVSAGGVFLVGLVVTLFHAARFPYFYIVLGLFPATIGALLVAAVWESVANATARRVFVSVIWVPLTALALLQAISITGDSQAIQRDSLDFVARNFSADASGFNSRAAFVCRGDAEPFPVWFHEHVRARFENEPEATENTQWVVDQFRSRSVAFMIPPLPWEPYPEELWAFWATRYVPYAGAVHVAGRHVRGPAGASGTFEVVVPGEYVWLTDGDAPVEVAGQLIRPGETIVLPSQGIVPIALPEGGEGMIVLALDEPPSPEPRSFYRGW